jgi:hypothetical protein
MNKLLLAALFACCANASAAVLGFDDIAAGLNPVPDGYGGFNWNNAALLSVYSRGDIAANGLPMGYSNGITSGTQASFNAGGDVPVTVTVASGGTFTFTGANFTAAAGTETLTFFGYLNDALIAVSTPYLINDSSATTITLAGFTNIDKLSIFSESEDNTLFAMDDFAFNGANPGGPGTPANPVPEPLTLSLMGLGLATLGAARRRKA